MPLKDDDSKERAARIDAILEELRLNTEDLHELAKRARERAAQMRAGTMVTRQNVKARSGKRR